MTNEKQILDKPRKERYLDFHTHTYYSDGIGTPELNIEIARLNGLHLLAITDHDKTTGVREAIRAGEKWQIKVIPGVEVSTDKYHILGLGINIESQELNQLLQESQYEQRKVCELRIKQLQEKRVPITLDKILQVFPNSRLGKMNILYTMMQDQECQEFFSRKEGRRIGRRLYDSYLKNQDGKWVVDDKITCITAEKAIKAIHQANGIAIIAHPFIDVKSMAELDLLVQQGLDGLEVQPRGNGKNEPFQKYAQEHNLLVTHGSDYHGGIFGRQILDRKGDNILDERLAKALRLEGE